MKKVLCALGAAIVAILCCCFNAWLGGYNFDHRGPDVATGAALSFLVASWVFLFILLIWAETP